MRRPFAYLVSLAILILSLCAFAQKYKVTGTIPIAGEGGWDYLFADSDSRLLYVSRIALRSTSLISTAVSQSDRSRE